MRLVLAASILACAAGCGQKSPEPAPAEPAPPPVAETPMPPAEQTVGAVAELKATEGNGVSGTIRIDSVADGVHMTGTITGLTPGSTHGFHVHENGDCSAPDASSAGGHFNPTSQPHGDPRGDTHHLGDIPNITADADGAVELDTVTSGLSLRTGNPNDIVNRAIIVHEKADDYQSQPSGDAGKRIACGIIK